MSTGNKAGLDALLTPEESVLVLIDHQPFQFANLNSHEPAMVVNNVVGLAKAAKVFDVPTILTTVLEERGGYLVQGLQDVFPEQKPINRTFINTWQAVMGEWQRDWAREKTVPGVAEVQAQHGGASGVAFAWEMQLLAERAGSSA
ncbi:hypothetical protein ACWF94_08790 [Streptomyces sp. NPDC055078]